MKYLYVTVFLSIPLSLLLLSSLVFANTPLSGKIIALDAGHGGGAEGATGYCEGVLVPESKVNKVVRTELTKLLEDVAIGAIVHPVAQLSTRKARVADAESANADVLISIHHNGSSNTSADYTQSFVTQKNDRELAREIQPELVKKLQLTDKGIKNDGYGMTVYGSLPGVLTESYFITNTGAACDYIAYTESATDTRIHKEASAMFNGLMNYFTAQGEGDSGGGVGKPEKCSPMPGCRG